MATERRDSEITITRLPRKPVTSGLSKLLASLGEMLDLPRVPQQARSREKRDEILKAGVRLFVERGYDATTSDDIAAAAGVSVGTFYNYFRNKKQVLITLALEQAEGTIGIIRLAALDFSQGNHREVIRQAIAATFGDREQAGLRRVWKEMIAHDPELEGFRQLVRRQVLGELEAQMRQEVTDNYLHPGLDIEAVALIIFTLIDTISLREYDHISDERIINALTDIVYRTLFIEA